jgi:hypothetical protein
MIGRWATPALILAMVMTSDLRPDASPRPAPFGLEGFCFPALEPDPSIRFTAARTEGATSGGEKLALNGHVTDLQWPAASPMAFKLDVDRFVIQDPHSEREAHIWDASRKSLHHLRKCWFTPVPGVGLVPILYDPEAKTVAICDFDPAKCALRTHWSGSNAHVAIIGHADRRTLVALVTKEGERRILLLAAGKPVIEKRVEFDGYGPANTDCVRGDQMLVCQMPAELDGGTCPKFEGNVAILHLSTGRTKYIGKALGLWWMPINLPKPYLSVGWTNRGSVPRYYDNVDEGTEEVRHSTTRDISLDDPFSGIPIADRCGPFLRSRRPLR